MQQKLNEETSNNELQKHYADMEARESTAKRDNILSLVLAAGATIALVIAFLKLF
jgi:hypothetical protein